MLIKRERKRIIFHLWVYLQLFLFNSLFVLANINYSGWLAPNDCKCFCQTSPSPLTDKCYLCITPNICLTCRNLRFSAYRSFYFWIYGKKNPSKQFRTALPSCLVNMVRNRYPADNNVYTGFIGKLPIPSIQLRQIQINLKLFSFSGQKRRRPVWLKHTKYL